MSIDAKTLSAACDAHGKIMLEMQCRRLLARGGGNATMRARLEAARLTDEQVGTIAADAFEAAAMVLAEAGYPGATCHECNQTEEP